MSFDPVFGVHVIKLRCGKCERILNDLRGDADRGLHGESLVKPDRYTRAYIPAPTAKPDHSRWSYRCHRRCGAHHVMRRDKLARAFRRALDAGRDEILVPQDLREPAA